jgi:tetratricopeptide (TPR) repeat protein
MRRWTLILALVLFSAPVIEPAWAQDDEEEKVDPQHERDFADYLAALEASDANGAADALVAMLSDSGKQQWHGEVLIKLADHFNALGLQHSALAMTLRALAADDEGEHISLKIAVNRSLTLADETGDVLWLEESLANNVGLAMLGSEKGRLAYLGAKGNYRQGNFTATIAVTSLINAKSDPTWYGRAQQLKGIVMAQQGNYQGAVAPLLTARAAVGDDPEALDLIDLNLARVYYSTGNYARAIEYTAKVSRGSSMWPQAQFERSWAHFRLDDMNGVVGILQTHTTPYFDSWYFPEAFLLRTYGLFLLCKFPEASRQIDEFQAQYQPVHDELRAGLASMDEAGAFAAVSAHLGGEQPAVPGRLLETYRNDETIAAAQRAVANIDSELSNLGGFSSNAWGAFAVETLTERRETLITEQGSRIRSRLQDQATQLETMLNDTEITKLDMLRLERKLYEQASLTGEMADARSLAQRKPRIRKGQRYWPYDGEIWADELGYYRANVKAECPAGLASGQ